MREFLARERRLGYVLLAVSLVVTGIALAVPTAMVLYSVGVDADFGSESELQLTEVPTLLGTLIVAVAIAYGRAFVRTTAAVTKAQVRTQGILIAAECLGGGLLRAATGEDLIDAALSGAALSQLVTGVLVGKWMHDLPRPAAPPPRPRPDPPRPKSGPSSSTGPSRTPPRRPEPPPRTEPPRRARTPRVPDSVPPAPGAFDRSAPAPGHVWFARVPFDDGSGEGKDRPCLVVSTQRRHALVLKVTSKDKGSREEYVRMPVGPWDQRADHDSWLELSPLRNVPYTDFRRPAGLCDLSVWRQVADRHGVGDRTDG